MEIFPTVRNDAPLITHTQQFNTGSMIRTPTTIVSRLQGITFTISEVYGNVDVPDEPAVVYLHRAWSPDNAAFVFWTDLEINLLPTSTNPPSILENLVNKCVVIR